MVTRRFESSREPSEAVGAQRTLGARGGVDITLFKPRLANSPACPKMEDLEGCSLGPPRPLPGGGGGFSFSVV